MGFAVGEAKEVL
jgi:hypothetical protein